jgi:hypothetical protein
VDLRSHRSSEADQKAALAMIGTGNNSFFPDVHDHLLQLQAGNPDLEHATSYSPDRAIMQRRVREAALETPFAALREMPMGDLAAIWAYTGGKVDSSSPLATSL